MMGKEQDTYRAAFIYMGTCLPWTCFTLKHKAGPRLSQRNAVCRLGLHQPHQTLFSRAVLCRPRSTSAWKAMRPLRVQSEQTKKSLKRQKDTMIQLLRIWKDVDRKGNKRAHLMRDNSIRFLVFGKKSIHCKIFSKLQIPAFMRPPSFGCSLNFLFYSCLFLASQ